MGRPCIFLSAVSAELAGARRTVARVLGTLGYDPVSEEDFATGHGELKAWLTEQIDACEGVIQLVGEAYGAEPPSSTDPAHPWPDPELGRCSYTQYELFYAWRQRKRTWVILIEPGYPRDAPPERLDLPRPDTDLGEAPDPAAYQAERRALQRAYVQRLKAENHLRHSAGSETELENLLLRLKDELKALRAGERRRQRRLGGAIAAVLAGLLVLGGGGWFAYERLIEQTAKIATVTTERIRAHLFEAVEDAHRRDLAQAEQAADWQERERRREVAEAQRAAQLARIDDLAASFAEIERQGETTGVFKELTRILQAQGVAQALAYVETKRPAILERVRARQAAARERDRAELEPLLTSARLHATQGQADAARGLYGEVLELEPGWPAALDDSRRFLIEQGDLAVIRGNLPDAKRDYAEAHARAKRLLGLERDNPEWQRNLSVSLDRVGDIKAAQGDLAGALGAYEEGKAIAERLAASDPSNAGWQRDLAISTSNVAEAKVKQGDFAGAVEALEEVNRIFARLVESNPSNAGWQRDLSVSLIKVGDIRKAQGNLVGALAAYEESKAIAERLAVSDPSNAGWQRDLSVSLIKVGDIRKAQGNLAGALAAYEESKAIAERLAVSDPSNAGWQRDLSVSLERMGDIRKAQGNLVGALAAYEESKAIRERLAVSDPSNAGWQRNLSVSLERMGNIQKAQGNLVGALAAYEESKAIAERLAVSDPSNAGWQHDLSVSLIKVGGIKAAQRDLAGALSAYEEGKAIRERLAAADPSNAQWQYDLGIAIERVGSIKQAQGKLDEALKAFQRKYELVKALTEQDPSNAGWQRDLYVSHWKLAKMAEQRGQPEETFGHWRRAFAVLQCIADRGLHVTAEDLAFLEELRLKLRSMEDPGGLALEIEALLETDPDNADHYNDTYFLYHDLAFDYAAAHRITTAWVVRHPEDLGARCNLSETLLTTGRTLEARDALADLIEGDSGAGKDASTLDAGTEAALRLLEIAALTRLAADEGTDESGDGTGVALAARRAELESLLAAQPEDLTIDWTFHGTLNYFATDSSYTGYRDTLVPLFEAAGQGRDALLGRLRQP